MKKITLFAMLTFALGMHSLSAQFLVRSGHFDGTGVSNQGIISGFEEQADIYYIWNPDTNDYNPIGGVSPGQGVGGQVKFSADGAFLSGTSHTEQTNGGIVAEMSRYNSATGEWTALGNLGQKVDNTTSAGYYISGDGQTVVGNSWADVSTGTGAASYAHGFAWNETEGTIDLGSMFSNIHRSSRANAVNHDGSIIVGYQDFNGPWRSSVWRKNPAGGYFPNEYLLLDPNGATDENNILAECTAISEDGTWIGGKGSWVTGNQPWIWSEATGAILLGDLTGGLATGRVCGISPDGNTVVGFFIQTGWTATYTPFVWTTTGGLQNANDYITQTLGLETNGNQVFSPNNMSANGKYISGWGYNFVNNPTFGEMFTFRLELPEALGVHQFATNTSIVFPNPVNTTLNITGTQDINSVEVYNVRGQLLMSQNAKTSIKTIDMSALANGIYFVKTYANGASKTHKIIKQ